MKDYKKKIINDLLVYTTATYLTQVLGIATGFAMRYYLEPTAMGLWSLLDLMLSYGLYASVGILTALYTELPFYIGKGDLEKARDIRNTAWSFTLGTTTAVAALMAAWSVFFAAAQPAELRTGVVMIAVILVATNAYNFMISLMWAEKRFALLSLAILVNAVTHLLLIVLLTSRFKLIGLLASVLLSTLTAMAVLLYGSKPSLRLSLNRSVFLLLFKAGLPLVIASFVYTFFLSIDRLIITKYLGVTALGHYTVALLVMSFASAIPKLLATVLFPNMQERFGLSGSHKDISGFVTKPTQLLAYCTPLLLGGAYLTAPYLVTLWLPKYVPGLDAMRVFIFGSFFLAIAQPIQSYLTTINKRLHTIPMMAAAMLAASGTSLALIGRGMGITGVAFGMSAGFFVYYVLVLFYVFGHFAAVRTNLRSFGETMLCFAYFAATLLAVDRSVHAGSGMRDWLIKTAVFLALSVPLLMQADKRSGALSLLWDVARHALKLKLAPAKEMPLER